MGALDAAAAPVQQSAAIIEAAFLRAGEGLGRSLADLDKVTSGLKDLTSVIVDPTITEVLATLERVAASLEIISGRIPVDTEALAALNGVSDALGSELKRLFGKIRMLIILGQSARIQASVVGPSGADFVTFTHEIGSFAQNMLDDLRACTAVHATMATALRSALRAHLELGRTHGGRLLALSRELHDALVPIQESRARNFGAIADLSGSADSISASVRSAIMSLQGGDAVRQRLEHVRFGIGLASEIEEGGSDDDAGAMIAAMCHLASAQLDATSRAFDEDFGLVCGVFDSLLKDTVALIELGQRCVKSVDGRADNAFETFQLRVVRAAHDVGICETARQQVSQLMGSLHVELDKLGSAVARLDSVVGEVVLIGINAGLRAGRLGQDGKSLVVVAHDLKSIATSIATDTSNLLSTLDSLSKHAGALQDRPDPGGGGIAVDLEGVVVTLKSGTDNIAAVLRNVQASGQGVQGNLAKIRSDFSGMHAITRNLDDAQSLLAARRDDLWASGVRRDGAEAFVTARMMPVYTMAQEREIHCDLFGTQADHAPAALEDAADFLF